MEGVKGWVVSLQGWEGGSGCELMDFCRLANQFTMTPDMRPSMIIVIIISWRGVEMLSSDCGTGDLRWPFV